MGAHATEADLDNAQGCHEGKPDIVAVVLLDLDDAFLGSDLNSKVAVHTAEHIAVEALKATAAVRADREGIEGKGSGSVVA